MKSKDRCNLPKKYKMKTFPVICDFWVPGFEKTHPAKWICCLCPSDVDMGSYFEDFVAQIEQNIKEKKHYPVLRISDGELELLFGRIWLNRRESASTKIFNFLRFILDKIVYKGGMNAFTVGIYKSGKYSRKEIQELRPKFFSMISDILNSGSVAFHLNYQSNPFHEQYFPKLDNFLQSLDSDIDIKNTIPFYFVYALFASDRARAIFSGKHICLVHSASPEMRHIIEMNLLTVLNVAKISWLTISKERSFYNVLELDNISDYDALFVGGGIGKANLFYQLSKFSGPIIDVGFYFEVWSDPDNRFKRVYCASDDDWISLGVSNVFEEGV